MLRALVASVHSRESSCAASLPLPSAAGSETWRGEKTSLGGPCVPHFHRCVRVVQRSVPLRSHQSCLAQARGSPKGWCHCQQAARGQGHLCCPSLLPKQGPVVVIGLSEEPVINSVL